MKLVKKWLFPALVCLIVVGAAALPPYLSRLRDARQFGQSHTEALAAETLPVWQEPDLAARLALYVRWNDNKEIIPSFQSPEHDRQGQAEELIQAALERLTQAGVIPEKLLLDKAANLEITSWTYVLLWDPDVGVAGQNSVGFWRITAELGERSMWLDIDQESGLPAQLGFYDPAMARWMPWGDRAAQAAALEGFLSMLGLAGEEVHPVPFDPDRTLYRVADCEFCYQAFHGSESLMSIEPRPLSELADGKGTDAYDG